MDFIEQLQALSTKIQKQRDRIQTEEATKNAFILPFIGILGYDMFDTTEVIPEFTADVGLKKGEKVDYAIMRDGKVVMLFECKKCGADLDFSQASQLYRYFSVTEAKIGILTDGTIYRFYSDLEQPNRMDEKPFMEFNMLDIQEPLVGELKKLSKDAFNLDEIMSVAVELKYTREIKRILTEQWASPSEEFVRFFAVQIYSGKLTQSVREQFMGIAKRALTQFINDRINERLKSAMTEAASSATGASEVPKQPSEAQAPGEIAEEAAATEVELEGYYVVKSILREIVDPKRLAHRRMKTCLAVLLDDNQQRPICKLFLTGKQRSLALYDAEKQREKVPIEDLNDIYKYSDRLRAMCSTYEQKPAPSASFQQ